jgi:MFS family permease
MWGAARLSIDLGPLRGSGDFRLLFASRTITLLGSQATEVALLLQLKDLTDSPIAVGLLGLAELGALLVFGLWGGMLADRLDRRRLMGLTEIALAGSVALLLLNGLLSHPLVWPLYVLAAIVMALASLQRPSIDATVPRTVERERLTAAAGVLGASTNSAMILGATVGGVLAAEVGPWIVYALDAASFTASAACLLRISPSVTHSTQGVSRDRTGLASIGEGLRYVAGRQELIGSYLVDLSAMFLASATALLPFVASDLHARWALGLMYAATSIGALIAAALGGWASRVRRYGRAIAASGCAWGLAMVAFGLSRTIVPALLTLVLAGAADMYSGMFRDSLWNRTIPDHLRGRVAGIELLSYGLGPSGGQLRAGAVASLTSIRTAIWSGGVLCVAAIGAVYLLLPGFADFADVADVADPQDPPPHVRSGEFG